MTCCPVVSILSIMVEFGFPGPCATDLEAMGEVQYFDIRAAHPALVLPLSQLPPGRSLSSSLPLLSPSSFIHFPSPRLLIKSINWKRPQKSSSHLLLLAGSPQLREAYCSSPLPTDTFPISSLLPSSLPHWLSSFVLIYTQF